MNKYIELVRPRHLIGNMLIFLTGTAFYWKINSFTNPILGLVSFLLIYASVYINNDLCDVEFDRKHYVDWKRKRPLASGEISTTLAKKIMIILLISGLALSLLVSHIFTLINLSMFVINYAYSTFKLKTKPMLGTALIIVVQYLKLLNGWLVNTQSMQGAPLLFFGAYACTYGLILSIYKKAFFKEKWKSFLKIVGTIAAILFVSSLIINPLVRQVITRLMIICVIGFVFLKKYIKNINKYFVKGMLIAQLTYLLLIITILL